MIIFKWFSFIARYCVVLALGLAPLAHAGAPDIQAADAQEPDTTALPLQPLTPEVLFLLLVGEISGARGEMAVAVEAYLKLAEETRDPRIARRATEVALFAHDIPAATRAARLWADYDPGSDEARRVLAGVLASSGERLNEVQLHLARILAESPLQLRQNLLGLNRALARVPDKSIVKGIVHRLTEPYMDEAAAHFARAQAAVALEEGLEALAAIGTALELEPDWGPAVLFKAQLLVQLDAAHEAVRFLRGVLVTQPENRDFRLTLARTLVSAREFEQARSEFQALLNATPDDQDLMYAVALVSSQLDDLETAETMFQSALEAGHPEADGIRMQLGQIAERRDGADAALRWYRTIGPGTHYVDAQIRIATALAKKGELEPARALLRTLAVTVTGNDRRRVLLAETLLLRDAGRHEEALALVDTALRNDPDDGQLLYESAMLAERIDRLDVMESRLRRLIELEPAHAHAYNALGYSLADRGLRLDEAESLILKALELTPDDPFILDSMGWVRFRRGDATGALSHLERAFELQEDPEIAAHLGEILWVLERQDEANRIWDDALKAHPDNDSLRNTVKRMRGQ